MIGWLVLIYAIMVAAGGAMGYAKAGSMASLIAGAVAGLALAGGSALMMRGSYQTGWWLSLIVTLLMLARFGSVALTKGFKLMPGGMVIIVSLIVLAALLIQRTPTTK
jgi:uncharacterized membrane protein (UPF0136 family)